jgi:hypothetical protein
MRRQIIFAHAFSADVEALGGYRSIDKAIETVEEALVLNPYAFPKFESDFTSFRFAMTKEIDDLPALAMLFTVDERGNVTLEKIFEANLY